MVLLHQRPFFIGDLLQKTFDPGPNLHLAGTFGLTDELENNGGIGGDDTLGSHCHRLRNRRRLFLLTAAAEKQGGQSKHKNIKFPTYSLWVSGHEYLLLRQALRGR